MRRLFGLRKSSSTTPTQPAQQQQQSDTATPSTILKDNQPSTSTQKKGNGKLSKSGQGGGVGLGLGLPSDLNSQSDDVQQEGDDDDDDGGTRRSKHVNFPSDPTTRTQILHPQPSFSSHHSPGCFPRSTSEQSSSTTPGPPKPYLSNSDLPSSASISSHHSYSIQNRTISPLSFTPSAPNTAFSSIGATGDPNQIVAPVTWSEMAHEDLVMNLGERERTRQEILWEVVASEERYVIELRSLVQHYVNPLLHPLLSPPSSPSPSIPSRTSSPYSYSSLSHSTSDLPIAAKFLRSINSPTISEDLNRTFMPEIPSPPSHPSTASLPLPPPPSVPTPTIPRSKLSSFRHALKPTPPPSKLHKSASKAPIESTLVTPIPDALRRALEVVPEMLKGHEELAGRLKEQWAKAFPLVRGLAAIWSDQPWFLQVYATYILSLEEALSIIDLYLPSSHSTPSSVSKTKEGKRLARFLMRLEENAAVEGEAGIAIAISKPLMRLGKLPLLMQSLLWHTDATTMEFERTRAMALEVDALVRSIEDEKIEEDEREKVRDVLARIEGIKDKALMAPRSSRTLLEEIPAYPLSTSANPRRTVSDAAPSKKGDGKKVDSKKSVKRLSDFGRMASEKREWLVRFSDVTVRCLQIGTTDVPGGFDRVKEKQGKQGKTKKKGKKRNLYRFIKVERWEMKEATKGGGMVSMEDISKARMSGVDGTVAETSEEEEDEDEFDGAESRMSFCYDADDPKPIDAPRNFKDVLRPASAPRFSGRSVSATTRSVINKQTPAKAKFGTRLPSTSTTGGGSTRYASPTAASLNRVTSPLAKGSSQGPRASSVPPPRSNTPQPPLGKRPSNPPGTAPTPLAKADQNKMVAKVGVGHERENSSMRVYDAYWSSPEQDSVPFPGSR